MTETGEEAKRRTLNAQRPTPNCRGQRSRRRAAMACQAAVRWQPPSSASCGLRRAEEVSRHGDFVRWRRGEDVNGFAHAPGTSEIKQKCGRNCEVQGKQHESDSGT